jgi:hypothetical protein
MLYIGLDKQPKGDIMRKMKNIRTILVLLSVILFLYGCLKQVELTPEKKNFQYNYKVAGKSKKEIWVSARNHFAMVYGDVRSVMSVQDEERGTLIGKGLVGWTLNAMGTLISCHQAYSIRFDADDGRAKLKLTLIEGPPPLSKCSGWSVPSEEGYEDIKANFRELDKDLRVALR